MGGAGDSRCQHVLSILIEPVFVATAYGVHCFDDCETARAWQMRKSRFSRRGRRVGMASRGSSSAETSNGASPSNVWWPWFARGWRSRRQRDGRVVNAALEDIGLCRRRPRLSVPVPQWHRPYGQYHEWCAEGIEPQIDTLQDIALAEELPGSQGKSKKAKPSISPVSRTFRTRPAWSVGTSSSRASSP